MTEQDVQPGAVILHVPTQGRYVVRAIGRMRTPPVGEWVLAARYTSLDEPESLPEFYRPLADFGTFELVRRASGVLVCEVGPQTVTQAVTAALARGVAPSRPFNDDWAPNPNDDQGAPGVMEDQRG
jgi:hypothetical protein